MNDKTIIGGTESTNGGVVIYDDGSIMAHGKPGPHVLHSALALISPCSAETIAKLAGAADEAGLLMHVKRNLITFEAKYRPGYYVDTVAEAWTGMAARTLDGNMQAIAKAIADKKDR